MARKLVINFNDERGRWAITPPAVERVRAALPPDWELVVVGAPVSSTGDGAGASPEALAAAAEAEVYAGSGFPIELFHAATNQANTRLKWVHSGSAGVASLLYPEMRNSDIILTNSAGVHAPPMAETVMAMALHFARGLNFAVRAQQQRTWDQDQFATAQSPIVELAGLTMGILGYGGIGREVARRAHAFGMRVLATRRKKPQADPYAEVITGDAAGLDRVLRESDVLVIALPATAHTRGLIGTTELARMKSNSVLISVSRGTVLREAELADALKRGVIRGAALDVFEHEPLTATSPLWDLPNVLITPHVSATTPRFWEREAELILDNFDRYLRGAPLRNVVDKLEGY